MSLLQLLNRPVTITRRSESGDTDAYGNDIPAVSVIQTVGELQQRRQRTSGSGGEPADQGEVADSHWLLILPAGTDLDTGDEVTVEGHAYELVGEPWPARNPRTQTESHVEVSLRRTAGEDDAS